MKVLDLFEIVELYCQASRKWCMYLSTTEQTNVKGVRLAAPYLSVDQCINLMNSNLVLTFDSEEEMELCFERTIGDDGPTIRNLYSGDVQVYALTFSNSGIMMNENT